jgi:phospholipid N-methyltransferase
MAVRGSPGSTTNEYEINLMSITDKLLFLRSWLRNPQQVGAMAPSGRALADLITADIEAPGEPIIELGPGTGAFTRALLSRGVPAHRLVLVEADHTFARKLKLRFPGVRVLNMDAEHLGQTAGFFGHERASAIVSGLPLLAMPVEKVVAILHGAFQHHLDENGPFYQFTYMPRCPVPRPQLKSMGLEAVRTGFAFVNFPPAAVYCFRRNASECRAPAGNLEAAKPACRREEINAALIRRQGG